MQRQWINLSIAGDQVSVTALPPPPHPSAPSYLQSLDLEIGFLRRGQTHPSDKPFDTEDMARIFLKAFGGIVMSADEILVFEYHGHNLKASVKSVAVLDLADEQRRGATGGQRSIIYQYMGIVMDKTDVSFMKAPDSAVQIKSSSKK